MIRLTSRKALEALEASGKGSIQRAKILRAVVEAGSQGLSRNELERATGLRINAVCGRVGQLMGDELIEEGPTRRCRVTGNEVTTLKAIVPVLERPEQAELFEHQSCRA